MAPIQQLSVTENNSNVWNRERGIIQSAKVTINNCNVGGNNAMIIQTEQLVMACCNGTQITRTMSQEPFHNIPVRLQAGYIQYNNCNITRGEPIVIQAESVTFNNCNIANKALKIQAGRIQMNFTNIKIVDDEQTANAAQIPVLPAAQAQPLGLVQIEEIEEEGNDGDVPAILDGNNE